MIAPKMSDHTSNVWEQMTFGAPHGRREVLWVEPQANGLYRVLNVPVWLYGISVGTLVDGTCETNGVLRFKQIVEPAPGGTVRVIVSEGPASKVYLDHIGPEAAERGIGVGPATFFDPLIVAIHVHRKSQWWPDLGAYLNELIERELIGQWEVGDPDEFAEEPYEEADFADSELVHPRPTSERAQYFRIT